MLYEVITKIGTGQRLVANDIGSTHLDPVRSVSQCPQILPAARRHGYIIDPDRTGGDLAQFAEQLRCNLAQHIAVRVENLHRWRYRIDGKANLGVYLGAGGIPCRQDEDMFAIVQGVEMLTAAFNQGLTVKRQAVFV